MVQHVEVTLFPTYLGLQVITISFVMRREILLYLILNTMQLSDVLLESPVDLS